jgi:hypothetical protein
MMMSGSLRRVKNVDGAAEINGLVEDSSTPPSGLKAPSFGRRMAAKLQQSWSGGVDRAMGFWINLSCCVTSLCETRPVRPRAGLLRAAVIQAFILSHPAKWAGL